MKAELSKRTVETFLLDPDPDNKSHLDYVCDWLENGGTAKELAAELEQVLNFEFSAMRLKSYLVQTFGPETEGRLDEARRKGAPHHAELSLSAVNEQANSNIDVSRNAARARTHQWMAEKYDGAKYGNHKHSVSINIGTLHLDALRARTAQALAPVASASLPAPARLISVDVTQGEGEAA